MINQRLLEEIMNHALATKGHLYSTLGADPDLGELVQMFVDEMPDRIAVFETAQTQGDTDRLRRAAHQLKGAAGSHGFDILTQRAGELEAALRQQEPEVEVQRLLDELLGLCRLVRGGAPTP